MKRLIVIRGNSGSGKTTVAKELQKRLGRSTMLLSQDTLRREILRARDTTDHPGGKLMCEMAQFGWENGYDTVIVEGIWSKNKYDASLLQAIGQADRSCVYYFDIPFNETLRRHATKPNANDYGEAEMRGWWLADDFLGTQDEKIINQSQSKDDIVQLILKDIDIIDQ